MTKLSELRRERRAMLEEAHGQVWDTSQLMAEFWIIGYRGVDHMRVERKADKQIGWLRIDDERAGRFYYNFINEIYSGESHRRPWLAAAFL
jgi:hypothetical protein